MDMATTQQKRSLRKLTFGAAAVGALASASLATPAQAQSSDALLNKLVEKGVLTVKEANDLKQETDQDFTKAYQVKTGLPDWVTSLKLTGDFRGRVENFRTDFGGNVDRTRYRYRLRFGPIITLKDDFEIGLRLASADANGGFGGNPLSGNTTLADGASRKFVYIDAAYAKWTPVHNDTWNLSATIGKMDNPFKTSWMVWDPDYQPEGAGFQGIYRFSDKQALRLNGGLFVLDELNQPTLANPASSHDPYVYGAQLIWEAKWTPKIETAFGVSAFSIASKENLDNLSVPNVNEGNTRNGAGILVYNYNPIVGSAALTYTLETFPFYKGAFPVRLAGEFMNNPGVPTQNEGYNFGVTFGKSSGKGTWEIFYRYQSLGADAWYEEVVDDDNSGFWRYNGTVGGGSYDPASFTGAIKGGTNIKGHLFRLGYGLTDSLNFNFTFYMNDLIHPIQPYAGATAMHLMADMLWRF